MHKLYVILLFAIVCLNGCANRKKQPRTLATNYYEQSSIEAEEGNFKKALQLINKSLSLKETVQAMALKATLLYQLHNVQESLTLFEKILNNKEAPSSLKAEAKNNYACVLNHMGDKKRAQKIWSELVNDSDYLTPEVALFNIGLMALEGSNLEQAENSLTKAVDVCPNYVDAYFYLALTQAYLKKWSKAEKNIETVLSITPKHEAAQTLLQEIEKQKKKLTK